MLWKLMRYVPKEGQADAFATAQKAWRTIRREPGFGGQCGGWSTTAQSDAWILGLWRDRVAEDRFRSDGSHDAVVAGSGQLDTLQDWDTDYLEQQEAMPGESGDLAEAMRLAPPTAFLRLADCHVPADKQPAFRATQTEHWLPAMASAPGMLGGGYAWDGEERFLVATLWRDAQAHARYAQEHIPVLREAAESRGAYPESVEGILIPLEPHWTVQGKAFSG